MAVFTNRVLNLKRIKVVGFDMDYTLVRYNTEAFERLTHRLTKEYLVNERGYPPEVMELGFDIRRAILGLVIDRRNGNLLQVSRYGKVKTSYHGMSEISYKEQRRVYEDKAVDVRDPSFMSLDTSFAISNGILFSQLVELKKEGSKLPEYHIIADDVLNGIDAAHRNGSLKREIVKNFMEYVLPDKKVPELLERYLDYGKKLIIITNSDYAYTKALLDYTLNPYWKHHKCWEEVFELVITFADKPRFFETAANIQKVDPSSGMLINYDKQLKPGIYQGGWFRQIEDSLKVGGNEILYIGDHIYGDVISIKKRCGWRTALVLADLEAELEGIHRSRGVQSQIDSLMQRKAGLEEQISELDIQKYQGQTVSKKELDTLYKKMDNLNKNISELIRKYNTFFNPYWGELLRAGNEESRYADQLERYACIYMTKVSDLYNYSPKTYFRPVKRMLPHELQ